MDNNNTSRQQGEGTWHLSKGVPVAFIFALVIQAGVGVWTAAQMQSDIRYNTKGMDVASENIKALQAQSRSTDIKLGRIEENLSNMARVLDKIDSRLDGQ